MNRNGFILLLAAVLLSVVFAGWMVGERAELYSSKSIIDWAILANRGDAQAREVLKGAGAKAAEDLVPLLRYRTSPLRKVLIKVSPHLPRQIQPRVESWMGPLPGEVRLAAIRALSLLGPDAVGATSGLMKEMTHDPLLRFEAAQALAGIGAPALGQLQSAARSPDMRVRHAAVYALGQIGPTANVAIPELVRTVEEGDELARASAAGALALVGPRGIASLHTLQRQENTNELARAAARTAEQNNPVAFFQGVLGPPHE